METMSETVLTAGTDETVAFDLLESKIVGIVEQLQAARAGQKEAEERASEYETKILELEETLTGLQGQNAASEKKQQSVRSRIEALLERIDSIS